MTDQEPTDELKKSHTEQMMSSEPTDEQQKSETMKMTDQEPTTEQKESKTEIIASEPTDEQIKSPTVQITNQDPANEQQKSKTEQMAASETRNEQQKSKTEQMAALETTNEKQKSKTVQMTDQEPTGEQKKSHTVQTTDQEPTTEQKESKTEIIASEPTDEQTKSETEQMVASEPTDEQTKSETEQMVASETTNEKQKSKTVQMMDQEPTDKQKKSHTIQKTDQEPTFVVSVQQKCNTTVGITVPTATKVTPVRMSSQIDSSCLQTIPGILKIVQLLCGIICMGCVSPLVTGYSHFFMFVAATCFIFTLLFSTAYLLMFRDMFKKVPWLRLELIGTGIAAFMYFLAVIVQLNMTTQGDIAPELIYDGYYDYYIAAGCFAIFNTLAYIAGIVYLLNEMKLSVSSSQQPKSKTSS